MLSEHAACCLMRYSDNCTTTMALTKAFDRHLCITIQWICLICQDKCSHLHELQSDSINLILTVRSHFGKELLFHTSV